jgi:hypothetical protein
MSAQGTDSNIELELLRRQVKQQGTQSAAGTQFDGGGGDSHITGMDGRLSRLEGLFEGLRHTQSITVGVIAFFGAILIFLGGYTIRKLDQTNIRVDQVSQRVGDLPGKISSDLRDITQTLATSITAAKQQPPQVIILPARSIDRPPESSK